MRVRTATLEDAPDLARVIVDTGRAAHRGQMPDESLFKQSLEEAYAESERNWRRSLQEMADDPQTQTCLYVTEDETGAVVGLAMGGPPKEELLPNSGEICVIYVHPEQHGRGHGRALVQTVTAHLVQQGRSALLIGCLASNTLARIFYERLGGQVVADRPFDEDGVLLPEVVYGWPDLSRLVGAG